MDKTFNQSLVLLSPLSRGGKLGRLIGQSGRIICGRGQMGSEVKSDEDTDNKGQVWFVNHKFDHLVDEEAERHSDANIKNRLSALLLMRFAFKSLGVVYGDLGTSPMYVLYNTFPDGIKDTEDVIDALSLIIYTLTIIPLIKYVLIVCRANDNGQGGTFALYSLLCRHVKLRTIPNQDRSDEELTTYSRSTFHERSHAAKTKRWLEKHSSSKIVLLVLVLVGSSMVIGDGILTPAISGIFFINLVAKMLNHFILAVLSAAGGVKLDYPKVDNKSILNERTEALFADVCQFPVLSIQIAFATVVYPCLLLAYTGQAAYLMKNPDHVHDVFYRSIPDIIYWPVFVVATAAAVVASQATISATFSLIKQADALGCFPRVKVMHTSKKYSSHIYIPEINWILMILCVAVTAGFKNQHQIGNACGFAVVIVMLVTTLIMILIMLLVWRCHWILVLIFTVLSLLVEGTYFSAMIFKIHRGGWVPLVIAAAFFISMSVWHYGTMKRHQFELQSKVPIEWILGLGPSLGLVRVPGVGLVYSELANGVPHIFAHFITNLPAIHSVVIFVCVKYIPVYTVPEGERFLITRVGPKSFHMFHCVARYGYKDLHKRDDEFEKNLFENLFRFMRLESLMDSCVASEVYSPCDQGDSKDDANLPDPHKVTTTFSPNSIVSVVSPEYTVRTMSSSQMISQDEIDELEFLTNSRDTGIVHILGKTVMMARRDSEFYKKILIDYIYTFLRKICRENNAIFYCPRECLLNVGQVIIV
ncbi:hypothetical protein CUMW_116550 [Citrus unshiu]|nr:hypothetical protein CUMW_116550 [Citrus unshiu]